MRRSPYSHGQQWGRRCRLVILSIGCLTLFQSIPAAENPIWRVLENQDTGDLKLRAETGDPAAQEKFAGRLEAGFYYTEAAKWYRKAAEAGRAESQYRLGTLLIKGRPRMGADRPALAAQPAAAIGWFTKAAEQGHGLAQLQLGQCYQDGTYVGRNSVQAYKWFILAADSTIIARGSRDRLALTLTAAQIEEGKRLAARFKAGDRSDSRIQIVTQDDVAKGVSNPAPATSILPQMQTVSPRPASANPPSLTQMFRNLAKANRHSATHVPVPPPSTDLMAPFKRSLVMIVVLGILAGVAKLKLDAWIRRSKRPSRICRSQVSTVVSPAAATPSMTANAPAPSVSLLEQIRAIDWYQFEKLIALLFAREGYTVDRRGGAQPDGGVDLELSRDGLRTAVQCKHWRSQQVGIKDVREFLGAMTAGRFEQGLFITINDYTDAAREFAKANRIELIDGAAVLALLEKHNAKYDPELVAALNDAEKRCPKCEAKLVRRETRKGANAGGGFWGCSTYPRCRFVLES